MTKEAKDVLHDSSHAILYKIAQSVKLPDYVEEGIPLSKEAAADTPDGLFADPKNRRFPLNDKANTWLSAAYYAKTASAAYSPEEFQAVGRRILKAASLFGIPADVGAVLYELNQQSVKAAEARAEALAKAAESCYGEPETEGYPMFNLQQVKQANAYFEENAYAYDWRRRAKIARNILRKSAEYSFTPCETVRKEAGCGFPRRDFLAENLLTRESELRRRGLDKLASDMRKTIKIICECDPEDLMGNLEGLREMISGSDELSGLDKDYGRRFLPPADFLFDVDDKTGKDFQEDTVPLGGELMSAKALSGLPKRLFESVLGKGGLASLLDDGRLSPKKISITVIKLKPHVQRGLLSAIRDYADGEGGYDEEEIDTGDEKVKDVTDEIGKDVTPKDTTKKVDDSNSEEEK